MQVLSVQEVVAKIPDRASLLIGGFMGVGTPGPIINEIVRQQKRGLTVTVKETASPGVNRLSDAAEAELIVPAQVPEMLL